MLSKEFLEKTKVKLEERLKQLEGELDNLAVKDPTVEDNYTPKFEDLGSDREENAQETENFETAMATTNALELDRRDVSEALERIKAGTYGKCQKCSKEISEARLVALPEASTCIDCAKDEN